MLLFGLIAACSPLLPHTPAPPPATPVEETALLPTVTPLPTVADETPPTETPLAGLPTATPKPEEEPVTTGLMPHVAHSLAGRDRCLMCHVVGGIMQPAPSDHEGWSETVCLFCHIPQEESDIAQVPEMPRRATIDFCLACHGPFEEVIPLTLGYVTPRDVAVNPHTFIPHDSDQIAECRHCHIVHPLPLTVPEELSPATVDYCYMACHHVGTFQACADCH